MEITKSEREAISRQSYSGIRDHYALACHFGVWDEGHNLAPDSRQQIIVQMNRQNYCFFWPHRPGMLLPAAEVLQKREADNQEASRDRRYTLIGLWIAAFALVAEVLSKWIGWP